MRDGTDAGAAITSSVTAPSREPKTRLGRADNLKSLIQFEDLNVSSHGKTLITFAWTIEIVGAICGVINSLYTTFGEHLPTTLIGYVPAVPMFTLAMAELGRVPLTSVFSKKHRVTQGVILLGIIALGYLAVENWTFGFERIVDLRLMPVNAAKTELSRAEADLAALLEQHRQLTNGDQKKRDELRGMLRQRDADIVQSSSQLGQEAELHRKNLESIRETCRIIKDRCMVPRSQAEDKRYLQEQNQLSTGLAHLRDERNQLQSQIDELISKDATNATVINNKISAAQVSVNEAQQAVQKAVDGNQIYRLAASWYRVGIADVTAEQFATARLVFSTFSAVAIAFVGSIAALVHYARDRVPGSPSYHGVAFAKLSRARRAYYARKRKPIVREIPGPERVIYRDGKEPAVIVEKEVPRYIDQIILMPWRGIGGPFHVNRLIKRRRTRAEVGGASSSPPSNVMPINKLNKKAS
jgi:hypothetical protein